MTGLVLAVAPASFLEHRVDRYGFDALGIIVTAVSFAIIVSLIFYGVARYPQKKLNQLGLACPTCGKPLIRLSSQIVIATGRCGWCGSQVLSLDEGDDNSHRDTSCRST